MKIIPSLMLSLALLLPQNIKAQTAHYVPSPVQQQARERFENSRFGIFIHWGIYSLFGQGEWYMQDAGIDRREYAKAANAFYPHSFDANAWIKAIKEAGAGYVCFTTRHHDGFSMWDTKQSTYNIMHTPYGRDVVKQMADACHEQNVGLHLYYSHIDWTRDDYPMGRTGRNTGKDATKANWKSYYNFMNAQLTELLTQYGRVDGIWFDGWWDHETDAQPFDWQLPEQYALIHRLQPACMIGNNHHQTPNEGEDMQMFERDVPGENKSGMSGQSISRLPLETCETMNGMWGYKVADQNYKSTTELIRLLVRTAAKGANLLLNVGPQPDGNLPALALNRLKGMGEWLHSHAGESIYGTVAGPLALGDSIVTTESKTGKDVYIHFLSNRGNTSVSLPLDARKFRRATTLISGQKVRYKYDKHTGKTIFTLPQATESENVDYIVKMSK